MLEPGLKVVVQQVLGNEEVSDQLAVVVQGHSNDLDTQGSQLLSLRGEDALLVGDRDDARQDGVELAGRVVLQNGYVEGGGYEHVIVTLGVAPDGIDTLYGLVEETIEGLAEEVGVLEEGRASLLDIVLKTAEHHLEVVSAPGIRTVF